MPKQPHPLQAISEEQLKAFLEAAKADAELQDKLKVAADVDAVVEIAKGAGFVISADELKKSKAEASDEDLEHVAGASGSNVGGAWCMTPVAGEILAKVSVDFCPV
ncbi:Nif11-like leader peptide family natural product precursor [Synechococcus sp. CB0101]|uniref:Nif11-like leader peptide family natural product precursor n=1 Tax=Synechococcus sp. CB0101 TaxID=232348 RepID=UPI0002001366